MIKPTAYKFKVKDAHYGFVELLAEQLPKGQILSQVVPLFAKPIVDKEFLKEAFENSSCFDEFYLRLLDHPHLVIQEHCQPGDIVDRLFTRAEIRKQIDVRRSFQNNEPDRLVLLLEEAAREIVKLRDAKNV